MTLRLCLSCFAFGFSLLATLARADEILPPANLAIPPTALAPTGEGAVKAPTKPGEDANALPAPPSPIIPWLTLTQPKLPPTLVVPRAAQPFQPETLRTPFGRMDVPQLGMKLPAPVPLPSGSDMVIELQRKPADGDTGRDMSGTIRLKTEF